ncbi:MAG: rhodanese-like domain-containing protein, partial [Bacteroidota bacterium]|nr:rhodanese-like domain-containing protein [Bacteroidota bacterium]
MKTIIIVLIFLAGAGNALAQDHSAVIRNVDVDAFKQAMDSLQDEVVVDLRTPDELKQGRIPGAIVIDYFGADFESAIQRLDKDKTYLLYCAGGGRSGETSE